MKKILIGILLSGLLIIGAGCSASQSEETLAKDQTPFPNYVLASSSIIQGTYALAANHPDVLKNVPCYCGCGVEAGHQNNLDCFVGQMGPNNKVLSWDQHGSTWDICVNIAREAVQMHKDGKTPKEIYSKIQAEYKSDGQPTPTPMPTK